MSRILVVYASKHGSTQDVALAIADQLSEHGHGVAVFSADVAPAPSGYDGVVVGGSLYMGRWHADARLYLDQHRNGLSSLPLAVFALGPLTLDEKNVADSRAQLDAALAKFPDLEPELVCVFGGVIEPDELRFPFNRMPETDARDWSAIRAWTADAAALFGNTAAARSLEMSRRGTR